jgi:hypothetical protein
LSAGERLEQYLSEVRRRLQAVVVARAGAVVAVTALLVTLVAILVLRGAGFPSSAVQIARAVLIAALVIAAAAMLAGPLNALRARNRARTFERHLPAQRGRIETYLDLARRREQGLDAPLLDLLAEDALAVAEKAPVDEAIPPRRLWIPTAVGAGAALTLALMLAFGPAEWGFGSRHLWLGTDIPRERIALRQITVSPGNATVRRNQDVPIRAVVSGFRPDSAEVFVRFADSADWERAPMKASGDGQFEFTLFALREPARYFVSAKGTRSAEHQINVADPPRIQRMRLTYRYPEWTGLESETDESSRDIRAVAGTKVDVEVHTTAPLESATLLLDGNASSLESDGTVTRGTIEVKKPGQYRISAKVGDELVPLTDEHQITLIEDQQPTIEFAKPGRDWQASSIEEVPLQVRARDDFRVQKVELHYSVNGGEWKVIPLEARGKKEVTGDTILRLEEIGELQAKITGDGNTRLTPGDLVTYYAVARDRKQAVQTDLFLIHVQPFERRFTQGQAGGMPGGGAGGDQENAISQRQREILLATWNLRRLRERGDKREAERVAEHAQMLAEAQGTLADQARTLIQRAQARGVDSADEKNRALIDNLMKAAEAMQPAAKHLSEVKLAEAIPNEQKALQHLLRADALYTDIQVQFQNAMAGGGNAGQAGRDLAEMFELEMDLDKNQYETESRAAGNERSQQLADALRKLRELAQRQERLARETARQQQGPRESDRWKQEQLRRETEELRRQLEDLARQNANAQQLAQQGRGQGQSSASRSAQQALEQVERALENMGGSSSGSQGGNSSGMRSAQAASDDLRQALEKLEEGRREGMAGEFENLAQRARQLAEEQKRSEEELLSAYSRARSPGGDPSQSGPIGENRSRGLSWERAEALAEKKRALQNELEALRRDMQASAQKHKEAAPDASRRVGTAANDLAESNVTAGLARSALELERGRGLQAAARERLITEALEMLQHDLDQAARVAAVEARARGSEKRQASPEELLAELSELRRAWQLAQAEANSLNDPRRANDRNSTEPGAMRDPNGQPGARGQNGADSESSGSEGKAGGRDAPSSGTPSVADSPGGQYAFGGRDFGGTGGNLGGGYVRPFIGDRLRGWDPPLRANTLRPVETPEFRRRAEEIGRRLRELMDRMPEGALEPADINALRQLANRLRRGGADPMEREYARMASLVDQLELAALNAAEKNREIAATRTATPASDTPEYREAVAEYYRRLGSSGAGGR